MSVQQPPQPTELVVDDENKKHLGGWLDEAYKRRVDHGQDLITFVDDYENDRGTGKTVLSLKLAEYMDRTEEGLTADKCFIDADEFVQAYINEPKGSALILDEAEIGADKYQAGSASNRALRKIVSMGRVKEKYVIFNMPNIHLIDRDLQSLGNVWLSVEVLGRARVHKLGYNKYKADQRTHLPHRIFWDDINDPKIRSIYDELTDEKIAHMEGNTGTMNVVNAKEAKEMAEKEAEQAAMDQRDELIVSFYETTDLTQQEIADRVGVSRDRVGQIVRGET